MKLYPTLILGLSVLTSCIGTDYLDDPKDPAILTNVTTASLEIGSTFQIEATYYYNMWQEEPDATLIWQSHDPNIATVDDNGLVSGISRGQTRVSIIYPREDTVSVSITVVGDLNDVAEVLISAPQSSIDVGAFINLDLEVYNLAGETYTGDGDTTWTSSNEAVATVNANGQVVGIGDGQVEITATVDGVSSEPLSLMVGMQARTGTFTSVGSYQAVGTATLAEEEDGYIRLTFTSDFATSFALGTFVYLANTTDGAAVRAQGLEIAEITDNGGKTFDVSAIRPETTLDEYRYVIILCKPASITFGYADLN